LFLNKVSPSAASCANVAPKVAINKVKDNRNLTRVDFLQNINIDFSHFNSVRKTTFRIFRKQFIRRAISGFFKVLAVI
jgi:hypothetical protein